MRQSAPGVDQIPAHRQCAAAPVQNACEIACQCFHADPRTHHEPPPKAGRLRFRTGSSDVRQPGERFHRCSGGTDAEERESDPALKSDRCGWPEHWFSLVKLIVWGFLETG